MSRIVIFIAGLLLGAAGIAFLAKAGWLPIFPPVPATPATASTSATPVPAPPPDFDAVAWPPPPSGKPGPGVPGELPVPPLGAVPPSSMAAAMPASLGNAMAANVGATDAGGVSAALPPPPSQPLLLPVAGVKAAQLVDTYTQSRGSGRTHDAIDIMSPRGTPVFAVEDGRIVKLFLSQPGGITIYQFDPSQRLAYYYAHLDGYAPGIVEGKQVKRGELLGYVGSTGNASPDAPHLHFAIFALGPEKQWWKGTAINPYPLLGGTPP